jgi:hypothetical protein
MKKLLLLFMVLTFTAACANPARPALDSHTPLVLVDSSEIWAGQEDWWQFPDITVYGDGTAIVRTKQIGVVRTAERRTFSPAQLDDLWRRAADGGLLSGNTYKSDSSDPGRLKIKIGDAVTTVMDASLDDGGRRGQAAAFAKAVPALGDPAGAYEPPSYAVLLVGNPSDTTDVRPWPLSTPAAAFAGDERKSCVIVSGPELAAMLAGVRGADRKTRWVSGGKRYGFVVRPLLPEEQKCADV